MTVYVDNARIPATVGRVRSLWSHLTADTPEELHKFAAQIGMNRSWFQGKCKYGKCPTKDGVCRHYHYDVTTRKRSEAIQAGAQVIDMRKLGDILHARKEAWQ